MINYLAKMWPSLVATVVLFIILVGSGAALAELSPYLATGWMGFILGLFIGSSGYLIKKYERE